MTRLVGKPILLSTLAKLVGGKLSGADIEISSVTNDSREVKESDLFIAIDGNTHKGEDFLPEAFKGGAVAAVVESEGSLSGRSGIVCQKPNFAASKIAGALLDNPSKDLTVIGVTGTNGKTTTTWIMTQVLESEGIKTLRIGTLGASLKDKFSEDIGMTTPDPLAVQALLARGRDSGAKAVVMEVSSHALHQGRVSGIDFDGAAITNISQDHLDYHKDMQSYVESKALIANVLDASTKKNKKLVVFAGDSWTKSLTRSEQFMSLPLEVIYPESLKILSSNIEGFTFSVKNTLISIPLIGVHNIENASVAYLLLTSLKLINNPESFSLIPPVPGRLEPASTNFFVDYAHTPDALERVLNTLKPYAKGKLWVVFGCGGDRDRGKRPLMGKIACSLADKIVVTSDNPRTERPDEIIKEILKGCEGKEVISIVDRAEAIRLAAAEAKKEDIVLVAGKGHETYQVIGKEKIHFSDIEIIKEALSTSV